MSYIFVNDAPASTGSSPVPSIQSPLFSVGSNNLLLGVVRYVNATAQTINLSDATADTGNITADSSIQLPGSINNYIQITTYYNAAFGVGLAFFYTLNSTSGNASVTATFGAPCSNTGIYIAQYAGVTNLITSNGFENENPGTGPNKYISGSTHTDTVPALIWGFLAPVHNFNLTPSPGTFFTGRTPCWDFGFGTPFALAEDVRFTTPANVTATWTVAENSGRYGFVAVFQEVNFLQLAATGVFVTP